MQCADVCNLLWNTPKNKTNGWIEGLGRSVMKQTQQNVNGGIYVAGMWVFPVQTEPTRWWEEFPIQAVGTGGLTEEMSHICKKRVQCFPGCINEKIYALWPVTRDRIPRGNLRKSLPCPGDSQQPNPVFSPQPENLRVFWTQLSPPWLHLKGWNPFWIP